MGVDNVSEENAGEGKRHAEGKPRRPISEKRKMQEYVEGGNS